MKKLILLLLFIPLVSFGQTSYENGFKAGFKKGYCQNEIGCISPIAPTPPISRIGESENSYSEGFARGVIAGKNKKTKDTKSSSVTFRGADKTLVEGAKAAAPKFTPTDLNLSKGSYNNNNKVYTKSEEDPVLKGLREDKALANMSISNAKRKMKWTKKTSKGLLKAKLKLGEIKKGDEEYTKLKMESKYGYDPATEESPLVVAMRNNIKRSNERLYGTPNN
tara:strand:+ start:396 stop:1061 length:666 start_codon:yes stop_codon:yes gene_type:complete